MYSLYWDIKILINGNAPDLPYGALVTSTNGGGLTEVTSTIKSIGMFLGGSGCMLPGHAPLKKIFEMNIC